MIAQPFRTAALASTINHGGVVACPAEAVWGLSCSPFSEQAVEHILELKHRPMHKGLIVVAADVWMLKPVIADLPQDQLRRLSDSWPGPNTWLVPHRGAFPYWVTGDSEYVAVRVSSAPALCALSRAVGGPVISTSANPAGANPARFGFQVVRYFGSTLPRAVGRVDTEAKPSTIRRADTGEVIRA